MAPVSNKITITEEESKICKLDGKIFSSSRQMINYVKKTYEDINSYEDYIIKAYYEGIHPVCLKTGKPLKFKSHKLGPWFSDFAKNEFLRGPHSEATKRKIKENTKKSIKEKYGVENVFETDWCKEKIKTSNLEKYGVENVMKHDSFKRFEPRTKESLEKAEKTNLERYGAKTYTSTDDWKIKLRHKNFLSFFDSWESYKLQLEKNGIIVHGNETNIEQGGTIEYECISDHTKWKDNFLINVKCPTCLKNNSYSNRSNMEKQFQSFLLKHDIPFKQNKRFQTSKGTFELDFIINDTIGIELNGNYYHSEVNGGKSKKYHITKTDLFKAEYGINVIHIFEDEWEYKFDIICDKILYKVKNSSFKKIDARKCKIVIINNEISGQFHLENHIQGKCKSKINIGLEWNNEIVSIMSFSELRISLGQNKKENCYELIRYSSKLNYVVRGGFTKLLSNFIKTHDPQQIISYADKRFTFSEKNVYSSSSFFEFCGETQPNYWYVRGIKRHHRFNFTKQKLIKDGFDSSKSEWEIMKERKYDRIWDCGHFKYEYKKRDTD